MTFWRGDIVTPPVPTGRRLGSSYHAKAGYYFLAPAAQVLSTFPAGVTYDTVDAPFTQWGCADALGAPGTPGYGNCTGTSMAAPHVAAIAGLVRSVQPTLGYATTAYLMGSTPNLSINVQTQLMAQANPPQAPVPATIPNANSAVSAALGGGVNRLTPLFSFYSETRGGHFYTSSPQAGKSAIVGTLIPSTGADSTVPDNLSYLPVGNTTSGYGCFPPDMADTSPISCTLGYSPRSLVEVFTTEISPYGGPLWPLYRLSRTQSGSMKYTYETDEARKAALVAQGWRVDAVEGYVMPVHQPGAARLCRKFNPTTGDYVLFPGSGANGDDCAAQSECHLTSVCGPSGYSSSVSTDNIGYAFPSLDASDNDADSLPNHVELREGRNPAVRDNDIFAETYAGRRLFSMQAFRDAFDREGDESGIYYWTDQLTQGSQSRSSLLKTFFESPEFTNIAAPVARLYFAYFLRFPDYAGLNYWITQSRGGMAVADISQLFANSEEFQLRYGTLGNSQFVRQVYLNVLGREPDQAGWSYWTAQLDAGMSRGGLMYQFSEAPEYIASSLNEVHVSMLFRSLLRRAPLQVGFDYWLNALDSGTTLQSAIGTFIGTTEYRLRFLPS